MSGYHSNTLITVIRGFQTLAFLLVVILYTTSKPPGGGLFYLVAPVISGVTCGIAIMSLLYRHVWNYTIVAAESVAFLGWIILLGLSSRFPLENNRGVGAFAMSAGFVLWAETAFVVAIIPLTYRLYKMILRKRVSKKKKAPRHD